MVDPTGLYVDGAVACSFDGRENVDYVATPDDLGPPPVAIARELITGLLPDDVVLVPGYPDQNSGGIAVVRAGAVIAEYEIVRFKGEPWQIRSRQVCPGTGLRYEGQNLG